MQQSSFVVVVGSCTEVMLVYQLPASLRSLRWRCTHQQKKCQQKVFCFRNSIADSSSLFQQLFGLKTPHVTHNNFRCSHIIFSFMILKPWVSADTEHCSSNRASRAGILFSQLCTTILFGCYVVDVLASQVTCLLSVLAKKSAYMFTRHCLKYQSHFS